MDIGLAREQLPILTTDTVSTLISDSGITRYRIEAAQWLVYDKTDTPCLIEIVIFDPLSAKPLGAGMHQPEVFFDMHRFIHNSFSDSASF